jgi:hypothetical protein
MSIIVTQPFMIFYDRSGQPLDAGYIYIGTPGTNPEVSPITVYWDSSLTTTAAQPIRTLAGYPSRNGSPSNIIINQSPYSIIVRDKTGALVYSNLNVSSSPDGSFTDVASATTTEIGFPASSNIRITGTTTINSFGTSYNGNHRTVRFEGVLTLTHNATSLILPGSANITTAVNDTAEFVSLGSGNWLCVSYKRASGFPVNYIYLPLTNNADSNRIIIQAAHDAAGASDIATVLQAPPGQWPISRAPGQLYCVLFSFPVTMQAPAGMCYLVPDSSVISTVNIIEIRNTPGYFTVFREWSGIGIGSITQIVAGARNGAAGFYLNSQLTGSNTGFLKISRCIIGLGSDVAIKGVGSTTLVLDGAAYLSEISDNYLAGGIDLFAWGDSIRILNNQMTGSGRCWISTVNGASELILNDNNMGALTGSINIRRGRKVSICRNNIENIAVGTGDNRLVLTAGGRRAVIAITGSIGLVHTTVIEDNHIGTFGTSEATCFIYMGDTFAGIENRNTTLDGLGTVTAPIEVSVDAEYFTIGDQHVVNNTGDVTTLYANASASTFGVPDTIALQNSWVVYGANFDQPLRATCRPNGDVHITGQISSGTITSDTLIGVLPEFMVPDRRIIRNVTGNTGSIYTVYIVGNDTPADAGKIFTLNVTDNTFLAFDIRFPNWTRGTVVDPNI